ncbi:hypothetical protein M427DRAFT_98812 [Gonapodya prolifera JEL478]|uniref:RING-type E3 ubiquitin transferase n=1 Tax=Gonapodya prolifera (strain JEL478) TaxID=1344416 RepID=A0A139AF95_GONPJ|nr:hypothetical protein M427DRAFT_98812 [Gonapodya prolifera JEL478]|eukprot:KXS15359.1 hypothetical protein M427DRAFT_98812 [Gonapodya prolifera JEL478]
MGEDDGTIHLTSPDSPSTPTAPTTLVPSPTSISSSFPFPAHISLAPTPSPAPPPPPQQHSHPNCPICLSPFHPGTLLRRLPCSHSFHVGCVDEWLVNGRAECPLCRFDVSCRGA